MSESAERVRECYMFGNGMSSLSLTELTGLDYFGDWLIQIKKWTLVFNTGAVHILLGNLKVTRKQFIGQKHLPSLCLETRKSVILNV